MKSAKPEQKKPSELRKRAEKKVKSQVTPPGRMSDEETRNLIHELRVHQIELEMQNDELRKAQAELEESRNMYCDFYDFAAVGFLTFDKHGLILEANLTAAREFGVERGLLIRKPFRIYIDTAGRNIFDQHLQKVIKSGDRQTCEIKLKRKDGSEFYAQLESISVNDLTGNALCRTSVIDITERKAIEERFWESRRYAQSTIDALLEHICVLDETGTVLTVNRSWRAFAEANPPVPPDYGIGTNYLEVCDSAHGPNSAEAAPFAKGLRAVLNGEREWFSLEYPCNVPDGEERWFIARITTFAGYGPKRVVVSHQNITDCKLAERAILESEQELGMTLEATTEGIWKWNFKQNEMIFSPRYYTMLGYEPGDFPASYESWINLIHPDDLKSAKQVAEQFLESTLDYYGNIFRLRTKNGEYRWIHARGTVVERDEHGNRVYMIGNHEDITERNEMVKVLQESEERFRTLIESAPEAIFVQSQGYFVYLNRAMCRLLGASTPDDLIGKDIMERIAPEYHEAIRDRLRIRSETEMPAKLMEQEYLRLDGSRVPVEITAGAVCFQDCDAHLFFVRDITERKRAEREMQKLTTAVEHSADWVLMTDQEGTIQYVNKAVERISGYTREELIGKTPGIFKSGRHNREFFREFWETILSGNTFSAIVTNRKKTGELFELHYTITPLKDQDGNIHHFVASAKDITEKKLLEDRLDYMAYYDSLTGLPNKKLFADRLSQTLLSAEPQSLSVAVVLLDIDRFTSLNETYGYEMGDEILKEAGRILSQTTSRDYTVGRIDSDKFGVILADIKHSEDVILALENMQSAFKKPLRIDNEDIIITLSAGIAMFPEDGKDPEVLMQNAEVALTKAKTGGINIYQFFTAEINKRATEFIRMQRHLFNALDLNEFVMHYQPYFDSVTREMLGMEALIRWNSPKFGLVSPGLFIPILEETGMIIDVGKWIIKTVCRQIREWMDKGYKSSIVPVYVNLSLAQFTQRDLSDFIEKTISETGIYPSFLGFEITESIFIENVQHTQSVLEKLRQRGISVNIDDFGTGYSSLSNLKRLPVNNLKIDISFIQDITNNPDDASIVITIISMAHNLNLKTIAEGVEKEEQWKLLRILKCDMIQGYYFCKPLPAEEIERLLIGGNNKSKRRHKRFSVKGFADLKSAVQEKDQIIRTLISDISFSGSCLYLDALIYLDALFEENLNVSLTISLISGDGSVKTDTIDGRIVYIKKKEGMHFMGIEFLEEINHKDQPSLYEHMEKAF